MATKEKDKELESNYSWDLESLLDDYHHNVDELFSQWEAKQKEILKIYPTIFDTKENFIKYLKLAEEYKILDNRLANYVSNNLEENLGNAKCIANNEKYSTLVSKFSIETSDFTNRVIKNESKIRIYLEDPKIEDYSRYFELIFRQKPHTLSDSEEALVSQLAHPLSGYGDIFRTLTDNDLKFADAITSDGVKKPVDNFITGYTYLKEKDRELRKTALLSMSNAFNSVSQTLCRTLYFNYLSFNSLAKINKFKDYIAATCFDDELDGEGLITHIYEQVEKYKPSYERFNKIRKQILKKTLDLKEIEPYDTSMGVVQPKEENFTIKDVQQEALNALKILGPEYLKIVKKAFKERWISWLPHPGKQTGAYSIGGIHGLSKYFISMNFTGKSDSLETIIHELGHSVNSYYINKFQPIYNDEKIFYAEISSTNNEVLLGYYLMQKYRNDPITKLFYLDKMISNFFNCTSRQIVFSEFEYLMNQKINAVPPQPFTTNSVETTYFDLMVKYLDVNPKDKEKYFNDPYYHFSLLTPYRIWHFYVGNFYVYKYAIGIIGAIINATRIYEESQKKDDEKKQIHRFQAFLQSGTSRSPLETVKLLGVDLTKDTPWKEGIKIVDRWIDDYVKLAQELKLVPATKTTKN